MSDKPNPPNSCFLCGLAKYPYRLRECFGIVGKELVPHDHPDFAKRRSLVCVGCYDSAEFLMTLELVEGRDARPDSFSGLRALSRRITYAVRHAELGATLEDIQEKIREA